MGGRCSVLMAAADWTNGNDGDCCCWSGCCATADEGSTVVAAVVVVDCCCDGKVLTKFCRIVFTAIAAFDCVDW